MAEMSVVKHFGKITAQSIHADRLVLKMEGTKPSELTGNIRLKGNIVIGDSSSSVSFFGQTATAPGYIEKFDLPGNGTPSLYDVTAKLNAVIKALGDAGFIRTN